MRIESPPIADALVRVALVAAAIWVIGAGLRRGTLRFDYSEAKIRELLNFHCEHIDAAFLGNSLTLEGVDAEALQQKLHIRSYNFAIGGASLLESEFELRNFLLNNPPPRVVALGVFLDGEQRYLGISPTVYDALPVAVKKQFWTESEELEKRPYDKSFVLFNHVDAYRYRGTIDLLLKYMLTAQDTRPHFVQGQARVKFSRPVDIGRRHLADFPFEELESFLRFSEERGVPVLVFEPPIYPGYSELSVNRESIVTRVRDIVASHPGARFVSFAATGKQYAPSEWVNLNHLNERGARHFTAALSESIAPYMTVSKP